MSFSKSFPRTTEKSSYPLWEEISLSDDEEKWTSVWHADNGSGKSRLEDAKTEVNARAKMFIYLIENKLIKLG